MALTEKDVVLLQELNTAAKEYISITQQYQSYLKAEDILNLDKMEQTVAALNNEKLGNDVALSQSLSSISDENEDDIFFKESDLDDDKKRQKRTAKARLLWNQEVVLPIQQSINILLATPTVINMLTGVSISNIPAILQAQLQVFVNSLQTKLQRKKWFTYFQRSMYQTNRDEETGSNATHTPTLIVSINQFVVQMNGAFNGIAAPRLVGTNSPMPFRVAAQNGQIIVSDNTSFILQGPMASSNESIVRGLLLDVNFQAFNLADNLIIRNQTGTVNINTTTATTFSTRVNWDDNSNTTTIRVIEGGALSTWALTITYTGISVKFGSYSGDLLQN